MEKVKKILVATAILLLTTAMPLFPDVKAKIQGFTSTEDPTPGYWQTSEYMIGSVAVGIILPESNGAIDSSTEDWNETEEQNVIDKIQYALDWWASQNSDANVSFVTEVHLRVPTSYEPIERSLTQNRLWISEIMSYLGYKGASIEFLRTTRAYCNDLREKYHTDWAFTMFIVDAFNTSTFRLGGARAYLGGPLLFSPYSRKVQRYHGPQFSHILAHEIGHIFWATDEYNGNTEYSGYLNVSDVEDSRCLMDINYLALSGKPHGLNGTWGQIGWRDSDGDGIQDIVDTFPSITLNHYSLDLTNSTPKFTGRATVTSYPSRKNITINKIKSIQFKVDEGEWVNTTITPTTLRKKIEHGDYFTKNTTAIVDFTFTPPELSVGTHFVEVKATNQWGNSGYANDTFTIQEPVHDIAITSMYLSKTVLVNGSSTSINVTVENQGSFTETFNITTYYNSHIIDTQTNISLGPGTNVTLIFTWNITDIEAGNYTLSVQACTVSGETDTDDNLLICSTVKVIDYPVSYFTYSPINPLVNKTVVFNATLSVSNGGIIINYTWNFGDGFYGNGVIAHHNYSKVGRYNVILTVTDSEGLNNTVWATITVFTHNDDVVNGNDDVVNGIPKFSIIASILVVMLLIAVIGYRKKHRDKT